jgi:putative ABC transport system ATP-binding protein
LPLLRARQLSKSYGSGHTEVRAVNGVDLEIGPSEIVLIMGPSGSGKTTLLSMLGGLLRPSGGSVEIDGVDITGMDESGLPAVRALKVGFIFQAFNLLEALTVEENILFPARLKEGGIERARPRADALLDRLGLDHRRHVLPRTLSGGEKQRVAIARALINQPPLILADEPTGNLDSHSGQDVLMILHDIARDEGRSILIVTHDPRVEDVADRVLWLEDGALRDRKREEHVWETDPVCGMRVDAWTAVLFKEYQGRRYVFCSKRCEERFLENPEPYASTEADTHPDEFLP